MDIFIFYTALFVSGLFIGSFLNVVSDRLVVGKSFLVGRSECASCGKKLNPAELIPVLSYFFQRGKCVSCGASLSPYYPFSEILTGTLFVLAAYGLNVFHQGQPFFIWILLVYTLMIFSAYIVLVLTDSKYTLLPNTVVYKAIFFAVLFLVLNFVLSSVVSYVTLNNDTFGKFLIKAGYWRLQVMDLGKSVLLTFISAFCIMLFFYFLTLIKEGKAMGMGDVKLAFLIGLFNLYPYNILAIFLGFLFGALGSFLLIGLRVKTMKDIIPFGPFMILGSIVAFLFGPLLLDWYFIVFPTYFK